MSSFGRHAMMDQGCHFHRGKELFKEQEEEGEEGEKEEKEGKEEKEEEEGENERCVMFIFPISLN